MCRLRQFVMICAALFTLCSLTACSHFRNAASEPSIPPVQAKAVNGGYEAQIREIIRGHIQHAMESADEARIIRNKPYYYREYAEFPDGPDGFKLVLQETDVRTRPMLADAKYRKIRYSTRMHEKREAAQNDTVFQRSVGEQVTTYELRQGEWHYVGSLFVAGRLEEYVNGEWQPVSGESQSLYEFDREQNSNFLSRFWNRVSGG